MTTKNDNYGTPNLYLIKIKKDQIDTLFVTISNKMFKSGKRNKNRANCVCTYTVNIIQKIRFILFMNQMFCFFSKIMS